ncbi:MAG: hypothetical protein R3321_03910, partial [Nitrososphaeraceae archaeon]|nr:hypothetical protein [Nitrososphaeraceae archaeon]
SDQVWTVAQFNADCDGGSDGFSNLNCENYAEQNVNLQSFGASQMNFNTLSPIELQQVNTCQFDSGTNNALDCKNDGIIDVKVETRGPGEANVELENPHGDPVLFQFNECNDLQNGACENISANIFEVLKQGSNSNIEQTNVDWEINQYNHCDDRVSGSQSCINQGIMSGTNDFDGKDLSLLGLANSIVYVSAQGANSQVIKADPDGFLTMENDCDNNRSTGNCVNSALNEALFLAKSGSTIDIDRVTQESTTENSCDNLRNNRDCTNNGYNTFQALATTGATIDIGNVGSKQTQTLYNDCNNANCLNDALNIIQLAANDGAVISTTTGSSGLVQNADFTNTCTSRATCNNIGTNSITITATGLNSDVDISKLQQNLKLTNTCSGGSTTCTNNVLNNVNIDNINSGATITASANQDITKTNTFTSGTHTYAEQNTINVMKTNAGSLSFSYTQTASPTLGGNSITSTDQTGSPTITQTGGQSSTFP